MPRWANSSLRRVTCPLLVTVSDTADGVVADRVVPDRVMADRVGADRFAMARLHQHSQRKAGMPY